MSNGERDQGPQGKAATQDVYARVASAAASRSGNGGAPAEDQSAGSGSTPAPTRRNDATGPAPANDNPFPSRAVASGSATSGSAPARNGAPATAPTEKPAGKSWKERLEGLTQRVMGTDDESPAPTSDQDTSTRSTTASAKAKAAGATPGKAEPGAPKKPSHAADDRSATGSTTVTGTPVAAPAARVTGTRAATPVVPPAGKTAKTDGVETLDTDKPKAGTPRRTRKARLRLSRLDPWSVMKTAFMFSIAGGIMLVVGVYAIWAVISGSGLFDNVNEIIASVVSTPGDTTPFRVEDYVNTAKVMGVTAFLACIDVVIFTALATLGAFLYNLAATMLGGLEITLAED